jgi:molecular chaperone DnaK (HSP70)
LQRKTAATVRFRDDTILYGDDALATQIRNPSLTFVHLRQLLGWGSTGTAGRGGPRWFEDAGMPWYSWLEAEGRGTLRMTSCCPHLCVSAEELNAILLAHLSDRVAATLAEERLGGLDRTITDVWTVITVPPWWGSCERAALRDAAVIGGIGGTLPGDIELVDSHAALAFKYVHEWSLRRSDEELAAAQHRAHSLTALLIDIGSTAVTASIVTLASSSGEAARALKPESVSVQAVAWEPTVGGSSFDELIASILRDRYAAQLTAGSDGAGSNTDSSRIEDLLAGARATATLLREGKRVKEVL